MAWKPETIARRKAERARWAALPTVRCSCGAVWKGRYAETSLVIEAHRQRVTCCVTVDGETAQTDHSDPARWVNMAKGCLDKALEIATQQFHHAPHHTDAETTWESLVDYIGTARGALDYATGHVATLQHGDSERP